MSGFTAPVGGDSKKLDNVELLPRGFQLCTLYSLVDIGTQDGGNYGPKHKVSLAFEFPQHLRVFMEGGDPRPCAVFCNETLSMHKEGNLRKKFVQPMIGKVLTEDEAASFDISSLLGKHYVATISHSPDGKWANIDSIVPLDEQNAKLFGLANLSVPQVNPTSFFHLSDGFDSQNFASLNNALRSKLIDSEEGKKHKMSGGTFAEQNTGSTTSSSNVSAPPSSGKLIMLDPSGVSYEDYIKAGWTDEQLISNGKAKKAEPVAPPVVNAPPVSAPPVAGPPSAPVAPVKTLVFKDPNAQPLATWLASGWTEEMIISEGHASFQ